MNTSPSERQGGAPDGGDGDFVADAAFDAVHVYQHLQRACRALEGVEEHAAAAYVAHAMAIVHDRFGVGEDHRAEP